MDRRNFLKGVLSGVTATGVIVAASPQEIEAFASPLTRDEPVVIDVPTLNTPALGPGEHLYNAQGKLVGIVTELMLHRDKVKTTAFDNQRIHVPGPPRFQITA